MQHYHEIVSKYKTAIALEYLLASTPYYHSKDETNPQKAPAYLGNNLMHGA